MKITNSECLCDSYYLLRQTLFPITYYTFIKTHSFEPCIFFSDLMWGQLWQDALCLIFREFRNWIAQSARERPTCHQTRRLRLMSWNTNFLFALLHGTFSDTYVLQRISQSRNLREGHEMGDMLWPTFVNQTRRPDCWPRETATWTWLLYLFESEKAHQRGVPRLSSRDGWFTWEKAIEASFPEHSRAFSSHVVTGVKAFLTLVAWPLRLQAWVRILIEVMETQEGGIAKSGCSGAQSFSEQGLKAAPVCCHSLSFAGLAFCLKVASVFQVLHSATSHPSVWTEGKGDALDFRLWEGDFPAPPFPPLSKPSVPFSKRGHTHTRPFGM